MTDSSDCLQVVMMHINTDQIAAIRRAHEVVGQTDDQIASGVVLSYVERCLAKPHLDICSWAYVSTADYYDNAVLKLSLSEGQWRKIDEVCTKKRIDRAGLIRWIIADTAVQAGYPR